MPGQLRVFISNYRSPQLSTVSTEFLEFLTKISFKIEYNGLTVLYKTVGLTNLKEEAPPQLQVMLTTSKDSRKRKCKYFLYGDGSKGRNTLLDTLEIVRI